MTAPTHATGSAATPVPEAPQDAFEADESPEVDGTEVDGPEVDDAAVDGAEVDPDRPVLVVSDEALARVLEIRDGEADPGSLCLRIGITGTSGTDYAYDLAFEDLAGVDEEDAVSVQGGLSVVIAADSVDRMVGSTLDIPRNPGQAGLVIRNPNRPSPLAGKDLVLTGDAAEKIRQLLVESVNPSLAAHGGYADLVGVEGETAYLTMGGGCQGCAMSAATLREGIRVAVLEAIPEITEVVDVTDHAAGDNPFYS
jgi:Fe/S biogenesis protein NfuA